MLVRGKVHSEQERYTKSGINQEITPIAITKGERTYFHMRPFALIPDIILTVGLYRDPRPDGAVGEVVGAQFPRAERIVTTSHDPMFGTDEYRTFLAALWICVGGQGSLGHGN